MNWQSLQRSRLARLLLWPASLLYGAATRARVLAYSNGWIKRKRLSAAVVSVGNLSTGGVGKTPMVLWLAEKFLAQGLQVAVLTRGYRGERGTSDEVELLRKRLGQRAEVAVGADRFATGSELLAKRHIDMFILDDGFQHLQLARDVDILLMDTSRPIHRESLLPAGMLREPVSAMGRADLLVFTRAETQPGIANAVSQLQSYPVFSASTRLLGFRRFGSSDATLLTAGEIGTGPFFAFCGLGNPDQFFRDLETWQIPVSGQRAFPDHHRYSTADVSVIERAAERAQSRALLTTEKDAQNLAGAALQQFPLYVAIIDLEVPQQEDLLSFIQAKLAQRAGVRA